MPIVNATAPPAHTAKPSTATQAKKKATTKTETRTQTVNLYGQVAAIVLDKIGQSADSTTVQTHWPNVAEKVAEAAETSPKLAEILDGPEEANAYVLIGIAVLPMVLELMGNHGIGHRTVQVKPVTVEEESPKEAAETVGPQVTEPAFGGGASVPVSDVNDS